MDTAIEHVSRLFASSGPGAIPIFRSDQVYQISDLANVWTILFNDGRAKQAVVLPKELPEVIAACEYKDELPPRIECKDAIGAYLVKRRM